MGRKPQDHPIKRQDTGMQTPSRDYAKLDRPDILRVIFYPRRDRTAQPPDALDSVVAVDDGVSIGCRFHLSAPQLPHILFFHGNGEVASDYDDLGPVYVDYGLSLLAADYRGYGSSTGTPTVSAMLQDAHIIFRHVQDWMRQQGRGGPLFVMGRSLGSASALELAACYSAELAGMIIESGFAYTMPLLQFLGADTEAFGLSEADGFRHVEKIAAYGKPTLIIHAEHDQFIPSSEASLLLRTSPASRKQLLIVPDADHNSILAMAGQRYFETIKGFISGAV
jgi:hypothetical protein